MASFFNRMRSAAGTSTNTSGSVTLKKDVSALPWNPLEKHLLDAGPIRQDGSDKFWGLENFGNTCYCNSILQCLYYSVPFREQVINYPNRTPVESVIKSPTGQERLHINTTSLPPNHPSLTYTKLMNRQSTANTSARSPGNPPIPSRTEDKEHPDWKKRVAQARGPTIAMTYDNASAYGMKESLFTSMKDIFEALYVHESRVGVVSPSRFLEILKRDNEMFRSAMHQDAHEFLNLLLNDVVENVESYSKKTGAASPDDDPGAEKSLEQTLTKSMPKSIANGGGWVHQLFEGLLTSETKCLTCENISQRDEVFLDLSVDLDEHTSVTSCLRKFSEEEMLCERNKFHCDICGGLQEAEKRMKIKRLPRILALHLKRFKYTEDLQRLQKLFHRVVYPYHLRLFNTTDDAEDPDRLYELYAVVVHIGGGPYHGHYISIIKTEDKGWLLFDDEMVEPVDKSYVQNFFGDKPGLACAYVLFYQETTFEALKREQDAEGKIVPRPSAEAPKEVIGLGLKSSAFLSNLHPSKSAISPTSPVEASDIVEKTVTEPIISSTNMSSTENYTDGPSINVTGILAEEDSKTKSQRHREEKDRRAAARKSAKEEEEVEKARRKTMELKRKEMTRKSDAEMKLNAEIARSAHLDDEAKQQNGNATSGLSGSLSRFKSSSKSFKKPKFLGSKDAGREDAAIIPPTEPDSSSSGPMQINSPPVASAPAPNNVLEDIFIDKPIEKPKNRFSALRKKTSQMILS